MNLIRSQIIAVLGMLPASFALQAADQFCYLTDIPPNVYYWNELSKAEGASWPGVTMQDQGNGLFCADIDPSVEPSHVIFIPNQGSGTQSADLEFDGINSCFMNNILTTIEICEQSGTVTPTGKGMVVGLSSDAEVLANTLLGNGIKASNFSYSGVTGSSGIFSGASESISIDKGIILTTGGGLGPGSGAKAAEETDPEEQASSKDGNSHPDTELQDYLGLDVVNDAAVLEFDFETSTGELYFDYVFASEEYNEFVYSKFNDAFALFVDGINIAKLPNGELVSINTVNNGHPDTTEAPSNAQYYIDNSPNMPTSSFVAAKPIIYDGFTVVLTAKISGLSAGSHKMKFVVADIGDSAYDSAIFIKAGSFKAEPLELQEPSCEVLMGTDDSNRIVRVSIPELDLDENQKDINLEKQGYLYSRAFDVEHIPALTDEEAWNDAENVFKNPSDDAVHMSATIGSEGLNNKSNVFSEKIDVGNDKAAYKFWGFIVPEQSGDYQFKLTTDDGAKVYMMYEDEIQVVVDEFYVGTEVHTLTHANGSTFSLEEGKPYEFQLEWFNWGGGQELSMTYSLDGGAEQVVPASWFYPSNSTEAGEGSNVISSQPSGIKSVELLTEDPLELDLQSFKAGDFEAELLVSLLDATAVASGTIEVQAYNGLSASCEVNVPALENDDEAPVCNLSSQASYLIGTANDELTQSESAYNSGLAVVGLSKDSSNIVLSFDEEFNYGDLQASFNIKLIDPYKEGSGSLLLSDVAGNSGQACQIELDKLKEPTPPSAVAVGHLIDPTTPDLEGLKFITIEEGELVYLDARNSSDVDNDIVSYEWDINGDGKPESGKSLAVYHFSTPGNYEIKLTVSDSFALTDTDSFNVTVKAKEAEPEEPANQLPIIVELETMVEVDNELVPISEVEYLPRGYELYAEGKAIDPDFEAEKEPFGISTYIWKLLDEDDNVIKEYYISTTPVAGEYELIEYHFGNTGEGEKIDTRMVSTYKNVSFYIEQEGKYKVALDAIDEEGDRSKIDENSSSDEVLATDTYVESSGSLGFGICLFLLSCLCVRRKVS